jgi:hypothetical protein
VPWADFRSAFEDTVVGDKGKGVTNSTSIDSFAVRFPGGEGLLAVSALVV